MSAPEHPIIPKDDRVLRYVRPQGARQKNESNIQIENETLGQEVVSETAVTKNDQKHKKTRELHLCGPAGRPRSFYVVVVGVLGGGELEEGIFFLFVCCVRCI